MVETEKRRVKPATRAVVLSTALLWLCPLIVAASHGWFWERSHATALVAAALALLLMIAVLRRHLWAWVLLLIFEVAVVASYVFAFTRVTWFLVNLAMLALLLSPQMRHYVGAARLGRRKRGFVDPA